MGPRRMGRGGGEGTGWQGCETKKVSGTLVLGSTRRKRTRKRVAESKGRKGEREERVGEGGKGVPGKGEGWGKGEGVRKSPSLGIGL